MVRPTFRTVFWAGAAAVLLLLLALAFRPGAVPVDWGEVTRGPLQVTVRDEGRTRVRNEYILSAPVTGRLLRVPYKPGTRVEAGDVVARILPGDPSFLDARAQAEARAAVRAAEAGLSAARADLGRSEARTRFAETELRRIERLRENDLVSEEALDQAQLALRVALSDETAAQESVAMREAEVEAALARLTQPGQGEDAGSEPVPVVAPVSGAILRVSQESEGVIGAGTEVMSLGDPRDLEVVVEMLSTDAVQVRTGADAIIGDWGREAEALQGRVRLVEPYGFLKISALGVEEQRVNVIIDFTGDPARWETLGHGYRVEAAIVTWRRDDVVQVPVAALFRSGGRWAVFRVMNGRALLTPVDIGRENGRMAEVLGGIEAGERVVLYPGEELTDGVRIESR